MGRISTYLNELKSRTGYTQQQLSDISGVSLGTIPRYFADMDDESANFEIVRKLVVAMNGSLDELAGLASRADPPPTVHETILSQAVTVASQAATLEARNEKIDTASRRILQLENDLSKERRTRRRMQNVLVLLVLMFFALAAVYIWDVRNLHVGLTAYFNQNKQK